MGDIEAPFPLAGCSVTEKECEMKVWTRYREPVEMIRRRYGYFPEVFRWRGRRFTLDTVEDSWLAPHRPWQRTPARRFFRASGGDGEFELYQDLRAGTWHLHRARFQPAPATAARSFLPARSW
jgi:hypothetical protein